MSLRPLGVSLVTAILSCSSLLYAGQKASCTFTTFNPPSNYTLSTVQGIADDNTVVGQVVNNNTLEYEGFILSPSGKFTIYAAPKSAETWMYGQNASQLSAGSFQDNGHIPHMHGFFLSNGTFTQVDYAKSSGTWLFDVSQTGNAVGSYLTGVSTKGFLLVNGKYTSIAYPNQQATFPMAVNDKSAVVGTYTSGVVQYGFLWQNGKFTNIDYPKSKYGTALTGINNSGVIVGNRLSADKAFGFIYENGAFESIVYPNSFYTLAGGINNNGVISGQIYMTPSQSMGYTAVCK